MLGVGSTIASLRKEKGLGQKELSSLLNLSIGTISNYENGVHSPDLGTLCELANLFDVTTDYLLGRTGYRCTPETLKEYITTDYTVSSITSTILSLDKSSRDAVGKYVNYLAQNQNKPEG